MCRISAARIDFGHPEQQSFMCEIPAVGRLGCKALAAPLLRLLADLIKLVECLIEKRYQFWVPEIDPGGRNSAHVGDV